MPTLKRTAKLIVVNKTQLFTNCSMFLNLFKNNPNTAILSTKNKGPDNLSGPW